MLRGFRQSLRGFRQSLLPESDVGSFQFDSSLISVSGQPIRLWFFKEGLREAMNLLSAQERIDYMSLSEESGGYSRMLSKDDEIVVHRFSPIAQNNEDNVILYSLSSC